jgi:hypothetical protein
MGNEASSVPSIGLMIACRDSTQRDASSAREETYENRNGSGQRRHSARGRRTGRKWTARRRRWRGRRKWIQRKGSARQRRGQSTRTTTYAGRAHRAGMQARLTARHCTLCMAAAAQNETIWCRTSLSRCCLCKQRGTLRRGARRGASAGREGLGIDTDGAAAAPDCVAT